MTDEMPLDLRSLGEIDSPEVVREALRRFRRSAFRSVVWGLVVVAAVASFAISRAVQRTLSDRIASAPQTTAGAVYQVGGMTAILDQVADLGDDTGFHLIVAAPGTGPATSTGSSLYDIEVPNSTDVLLERGRTDRLFDLWFTLRAPPDGKISLPVKLDCDSLAFSSPEGRRVCSNIRAGLEVKAIGTIEIDLEVLGIPASIWR